MSNPGLIEALSESPRIFRSHGKFDSEFGTGSNIWPGNMAFYIDVEDLDAYSQKIRDAGGKMIVEKIEVPGTGAFSLFEDPDGRVLGIWLQKK